MVERPASAVKELVENAVDAGCSRCDVEIEGGGITRIVVTDDGSGMTAEDAKLCVERHATSKLFAIDDLGRLATYGFRGEALPSIASVSRFSLRTRAVDENAGVEVRVDGGASPSISLAGLAVGTTVEVRDLFFNVVARRKFLRSSGTEAGHVGDVMEAAAMSHPEVTFTLCREGRRVREWLRAKTRAERVRTTFDEELAECRGERGPLRVEGYLSRPERARSGAMGLRLFVNNRSVRDRALLHTVAQSYGSVLERGRYPRGVVYIDLPPVLVDVNVHPQKAEVRFADARAVADALYRVLSVELARAFSLPSPARSQWGNRNGEVRPFVVADPRDLQTAKTPETNDAASAPRVDRAAQETEAAESTPTASDPARDDCENVEQVLTVRDGAAALRPGPEWSALRFVAQVRQTYLICEGRDGLYVIDQHAGAERVNFDRLRRQYQARTVASQALLFPMPLAVTADEAELVEEKAAEFRALGLDLRARGPETVSIHAAPKLLSRASPEQLVRDLLAEVSRTGNRAFSDAVDLALATMACHGSIRAGDPVSPNEAAALLTALDQVDFAGHCPHGRPLVAFTAWGELERRVGRR